MLHIHSCENIPLKYFVPSLQGNILLFKYFLFCLNNVLFRYRVCMEKYLSENTSFLNDVFL